MDTAPTAAEMTCTGPRVSRFDRCFACPACRLAAEWRDHEMRVRLYGAAKVTFVRPVTA